MIETNLMGQVHGSRAALAEFLRQGQGTLINMASVWARVTTPVFENAATYAGRRPRPIPPLLDADQVAHGIVRCAQSPAREITYRRVGRAVELLHSLAPRRMSAPCRPVSRPGTTAGSQLLTATGMP